MAQAHGPDRGAAGHAFSHRLRLHAYVHRERKAHRLRQRRAGRIPGQHRIGDPRSCAGRRRAYALRGRRVDPSVAGFPGRFRAHRRHSGHRGLRLRRVGHPRLHEAGPGSGERRRRRLFPAMALGTPAGRLRAWAPVSGASGMELVPAHHRVELWPGPRAMEAKGLPGVDAARARRGPLRGRRNRALDESGEQHRIRDRTLPRRPPLLRIRRAAAGFSRPHAGAGT